MIKLKTKAILKAAVWLIPLALLTNCSARIGTAVVSDDYGYDYYPYTYAYPYVKFGGPYYYHHHRHHGHKHK